jgi:hypothetical protein
MAAQGGEQLWPGSLLDDPTYNFSGDSHLGNDPPGTEYFDPSFGDPNVDVSEFFNTTVLPEIPDDYRSGPNVPPWGPASLQSPTDSSPMFMFEGPGSTFPSSYPYQPELSISPQPIASPQPRSPLESKPEPTETGSYGSGGIARNRSLPTTSKPITIPKTTHSARVKKTKKDKLLASSSSSTNTSLGQFHVVTLDSIHAHANSTNPFECFEPAKQASTKGRKGPLADDSRIAAKRIRQFGACFCCRARKVKCDLGRPCGACKRMMVQVPQLMCWKFDDFLTYLFPTFIRDHLHKVQIAKFISENVVDFAPNGIEQRCEVELFGGSLFSSTIRVPGRFFTPREGAEITQHWHLHVLPNSTVERQARYAPPIGLDIESSQQREELRTILKTYLSSLRAEPGFATQLTADYEKHSRLPSQILSMVHGYYRRSPHPIIEKALNIYALQYTMTHHLCLTSRSISSLNFPHLHAQNNGFITLRLLNRQLKSLVDELLQDEMTLLFELLTKTLKPKARDEYVPCLAAFLVLCLFMESLQAGTDTFVSSSNDVWMQDRTGKMYDWRLARDANMNVVARPFAQFALMFHQIYATYSKEAAVKGFNPLMDDGCLEELKGSDRELMLGLRGFMEDADVCELPSYGW